MYTIAIRDNSNSDINYNNASFLSAGERLLGEERGERQARPDDQVHGDADERPCGRLACREPTGYEDPSLSFCESPYGPREFQRKFQNLTESKHCNSRFLACEWTVQSTDKGPVEGYKEELQTFQGSLDNRQRAVEDVLAKLERGANLMHCAVL